MLRHLTYTGEVGAELEAQNKVIWNMIVIFKLFCGESVLIKFTVSKQNFIENFPFL